MQSLYAALETSSSQKKKKNSKKNPFETHIQDQQATTSVWMQEMQERLPSTQQLKD